MSILDPVLQPTVLLRKPLSKLSARRFRSLRRGSGFSVEAFFIGLGAIATKWILRLWTDGTPFGQVSSDFIDLIPPQVSGLLERRRASRELDDVADDMSHRMSEFVAAEIRGMDKGELAAAVGAVQESLSLALVTTPVILGVDLDISAVETYVRSKDPQGPIRAGLDAGGIAAYDAVLAEYVRYIVSVAVRLPSFRAMESAELLTRSTALRRLVEEVLENLPSSSVPSAWGNQEPSRAFENKYRTVIYNYADRMRLFGVPARIGSAIYSLSVGYISLSVDSGSNSAHNRNAKLDDDRPDSTPRRVEAALGQSARALIAGDAGSGKTTLLHWIACKAAQSGFGREMDDWNGLVPFIIPLRRYVDSDLPKPEEFLSATASTLSGAMPAGWVHDILADGRGVVLVDGVDELPEDKRLNVRAWLENLVRDFPNNRFVLTSRSTAIDSRWADIAEFNKVELLPMEPPDIATFVEHWYDAAQGAFISEDVQSELQLAQASVLRAVRDRPTIRSLCTNPLLCALICALSFERQSHLPENRMELYEVALEMLVERRDNERGIRASPAPDVKHREAVLLLKGFAAWMHENGLSDTTKRELEIRVAGQLPSMHSVVSSAQDVTNHLLVRTGILREPVIGRVDFVHRTFLEYLAAASIVDDNSIEKLVMHAHEDHWREVIVLASGHAGGDARTRLLRGLIDRGDAEQANRHRIYLLALACMETSPSIEPEVQAELERCLREVIPPRNMTDAGAVASAGLLAVPLLARKNSEIATTAAACVRSLALIGGPEALAALETYAEDGRLTVSRQLIRAWSAFEPEEYANRVLRHSPLDAGHITIQDASQLPFLDRLGRLTSAAIDLRGRIRDLSAIPPVTAIKSIDVSLTQDLFDLRSFSSASAIGRLDRLSLTQCQGLESLAGLEGATVTELDLYGCQTLEDVSALSQVKGLKNLHISGSAVRDLSPLGGHRLDYLSVMYNARLATLGPSIDARTLTLALDGRSKPDLGAITNSKDLRDLSVTTLGDSIEWPVLPRGLRTLDLNNSQIVDLRGATKLRRLLLDYLPDSALERFVADRPSITLLELTVFDEEVDWDRLASLAAIRPNAEIRVHSLSHKSDAPPAIGFVHRQYRSYSTYVRAPAP